MHHKIGWGDHQEWWVWEDFEGRSDTETLRLRAVFACPEGEGPNSNFVPVGFECVFCELYMPAYMEMSPIEIQTPTQWNLKGYNVPPVPFPRRLCYRPAVFFSQLRPVALSFSQGKILRAFEKY